MTASSLRRGTGNGCQAGWAQRPCKHRLARRRMAAKAAQIQDVSAEQLEVKLAERERTMIIDFYADWCGPCILLADELKKGLPTMIFVGMGNEPALRTEGLMAADSIKDIVQKMQTSHDEAIKAIEQAPTDAPEPGPASASA